MSNKTKEEIEQLGREIHYQSQNEGLDSNGCFNQYQGFIKGYTQCQETLTTRILELDAQIESLTNIAVMEVSCKEDLKTKLNDEAIDLFINNYIKSLPHNWRTTLDMYLAMKNAMLESLSYPNKY